MVVGHPAERVDAQLASVLGGSDGERARLKFPGTESGGWSDALLDHCADALILDRLALYRVGGHDTPTVAMAGFAALTVLFPVSHMADKRDDVRARRGGVHLRIGCDLRILPAFLCSLPCAALATLRLLGTATYLDATRRIVAFPWLVGDHSPRSPAKRGSGVP